MPKKQRLKKSSDFSRTHSQGLSYASRLLVMRAMQNGLPVSRFGLSVGHRVGIAVTRNRIKRLLRESLRQEATRQGWDVVFIARLPAATASYQEMHQSARTLLQRAKLLEQKADTVMSYQQEGKP